MITTESTAAKRSRWMDWQPEPRISAVSSHSNAPKPSKPGSEGFDGSTLGEFAEIDSVPDTREGIQARALLNRTGVRIVQIDGTITIGMWSDLDGSEIRVALRVLGHDLLPLLYLDGSGTPMQLKSRRVKGEPVPMHVLAEMERQPAEPWTARDRKLTEIGWCSKGIAEAERKARMLKPLFQEQGVTWQERLIAAGESRRQREQQRRVALALFAKGAGSRFLSDFARRCALGEGFLVANEQPFWRLTNVKRDHEFVEQPNPLKS